MFQNEKLFNKRLYWLGVLLVITLLFNGCEYKKNIVPNADLGTIDLSNWSFEKDGPIKLDGQWELYWGQLLTPKDFKDNPELKTVDFLEVPGKLDISVNKNKLPKFGYGTMRLKIKMSDDAYTEVLYGIRTHYILSASRIWINDQLMTSTGAVSKSESNAIGSYERQVAFFPNEGNDLEIIIQMSNYNNITGKIKSIFLGNSKQIKRDYVKHLALDAFVIGCLSIMGIYHFALYYKRQKNKATLYFGVFCLLIALRNVLVGQRLIFEIFHDIPFSVFNKLAYLTVYSALPFIIMFFREIFIEEISWKVVNVLNCISVIVSIVTLLSSIEFYNKFLLYYEICMVLTLIYLLFIIVKANINKNESALIILIGFIVFSSTIIHDMLLQAGVIYTTSLAPLGLLFFIFSQSYMLASQFSNAFIAIEKLVVENKAVFSDELTGILNRRGFYEQGSSLYNVALSNGSNFILFYGDLNKFKSINDSFGHKEGDEALKKTAEILKNSLGKHDILARIGGDEFVIILLNKSSEEAKDILKHINKNFDKYNSTSNKPYKLLISFGYSSFDSNVIATFEDLIHEADRMLYEEKAKMNLKLSVKPYEKQSKADF